MLPHMSLVPVPGGLGRGECSIWGRRLGRTTMDRPARAAMDHGRQPAMTHESSLRWTTSRSLRWTTSRACDGPRVAACDGPRVRVRWTTSRSLRWTMSRSLRWTTSRSRAMDARVAACDGSRVAACDGPRVESELISDPLAGRAPRLAAGPAPCGAEPAGEVPTARPPPPPSSARIRRRPLLSGLSALSRAKSRALSRPPKNSPTWSRTGRVHYVMTTACGGDEPRR